jgi:hypothetical protein
MRTTRFAVAIVAGFIGLAGGAAQAASDGAEIRAAVGCEARVAVDPSFESGTATTTDEHGVTHDSPVRTLVEGDDLTVIHVDRIEFYRITGPNKVELIGAIERPADLTAEAGSGNGCS